MTTVAVISSHDGDAAWIARALGGALDIVAPERGAELIVASADELARLTDSTAIVVAIGEPAVATPRIAHVITRAWHDAPLRDLLVALASRRPHPASPPLPPRNPLEAQGAQQAIAAVRMLATAGDLAAFEHKAVEIVLDLVDADRAYCVFHDAAEAALWSEATAHDDRRATAGLVGFAARTGRSVRVERAGDDPRFSPALDDPSADPTTRLLVEPVVGGDGEVHALLVAVRGGRRLAFEPEDAAKLARVATLAAPVLDQLALARDAQAVLDEAYSAGLFRREAVEARSAPRWGDVIRVTPRWVPWMYWMLVGLLVASALFIALGTVATYSAGPAIIRSSANTPITARTAGNIVAVEVSPGDQVETGAVIARLDDTDQRATVARLEHEFETQLRNHMLDPADAVADGALRTVRNELETARTSLGERLIRASAAGVIGDVRVHFGQHVAPGDIVASVVDSSQRLEAIALLPGEDRPQLAPGMGLRLELAGYPYAYQTVVIDRVSPDVISPGEARRILGAEVADSLAIAGPVVLVRGWLPSSEFTIDGRTLRYHDGMRGTAEVRVRSERILFALVPGARRLR